MSLVSPCILLIIKIMSSLFGQSKSIELFLFFDSVITVETEEMSVDKVKSDDRQIAQQNHLSSCFGLGAEN